MAADYTNTIRNLRTKLIRQQAAVEDTQAQIEVFEKLQAENAKKAK